MLSASRQMLSASAGSFKRRYRSAFARALGTASSDKVLSSNMLASAEHPQQLRDRIVQLIDDALFERNDSVVGNSDPFRAHLRAALGDVAVADPVRSLQAANPVLAVERI